MKISKAKGPAGPGKGGKAGKSTSSSTAVDFRQLLQAQLDSVVPVQQNAPVAEVVERQESSPQLRLQGVQLAEATIDSLDSFAQVLADASLSADELEPFIAALEEESQGLIDIKEQLASDDPLAQLIEQVASTCFLETSKFRRGDYS